MRPGRIMGLIALIGLGACDRAKKPEPKPEPVPVDPSAVAQPSAGVLADSGVLPPPADPSLDLGPAGESQSREQRQRAVWSLIRGEQPASRLPEIATEPGKSLDLHLRDQLSPRSGGLLGVGGPGSLTGNAALGDVIVKGPVTNGPLGIARMRGHFRGCYSRGLRLDPGAKGVVKLTLSVDATGKVTAVDAKTEGTLPVVVSSCIKARAATAVFEATGAGVVKATVTLSPAK